MPLTGDDFRELIDLLLPVFPTQVSRTAILAAAFFGSPQKQHAVDTSGPATMFVPLLLSHFYTVDPEGLITLLETIQHLHGGALSARLTRFIDALK